MTRTSYKQTYTPEKKICKCGHTLSYGSYLAIYWCDYCDAEPIVKIVDKEKASKNSKKYYERNKKRIKKKANENYKKKKVKNLISET